MASQIVTVAMSNPYADRKNTIVVTFTSATAETVTAAIAATYAAAVNMGDWYSGKNITKLQGYVTRVVTNPGATAPSDNWDMTLLDGNGVDVLAGLGANRDTATSEEIVLPSPVYVDSDLTLTLTNCGAEKTGTVTIYMDA